MGQYADFIRNNWLGKHTADCVGLIKGYGWLNAETMEIKYGTQKLRVAAYCRVSSSSEDQLNSFAAQNIHYTQYISEHEDWRLVDIYADEGITGTSVEKREDFKRMLADSGRGLIDRILVKSISRFARNTAECLEAMLSQTYEAEQKQLEAEAITLQQEIEVQERQNENIEKFIQKAHKYVGIEELDGYALRELVSAIYVDAPDKSSGKRVQHIHIKYDGLGFIPLNELMKKETA